MWEGFSLRWYQAAWRDPQLGEATLNSLIIAFTATALSTAIGTLCAYGLWKRGAPALSGSLYLSLVTPEIVTGVSLLAFYQWVFRYLRFELGLHTVILAHVAFSLAYVVIVALAPGIAAAALLAFTISFDDYVITSMVAGVDSETLPMVIYAMARRGANPVVNAISALIVLGLGGLVLLSERLRGR